MRRRERVSWYLYDLANQMYPFIVLSFVFIPWIGVEDDLAAQDAAFMVPFSLSMLVALLMAPVLGAVTDRIGRRPVLITTTLVAVVSIMLLGSGELMGLSPGATLVVALAFFALANLAFQLGVVAYDAFLPAVALKGSLGRTGGFGIGVGYIGSFLALGLTMVIMGPLGLGEPVVFIGAGLLFLLLALPAFIFLRDDLLERGVSLMTQVKDSVRSAMGAVKALPRDRVLSRFLLTRFFYADAINTMILIMGLYAVAEVGFERGAPAYFLLLGLGILFAVLTAPFWGFIVDKIGPRHTLLIVLMGWCLTIALVVVHPVLGLAQELFYLIGALVGVFLAGTWTSDRPLLVGVAPPERVGEWFGLYALAGRFAAITGPITWVLVVDVLFAGSPGARQFGMLTILATMFLALFLIRKLPDPFVTGASPLQPVTPWGEGSGASLKRPWHLVRAPFVPLYLVASWVIFFAMSPQPHASEILVVSADKLRDVWIFSQLYFWLPDLIEAPWLAISSIVTAPLVNVHLVQLIYVSLLLVLFGWILEVREGSARFVLIFFATSAFGAIFAGLLHWVLYPGLLDTELLAQAERMLWTGGSAGAFGVMGAVAARARVWWPLMAFFVLWELNVGWWYLESYTPAFHLSALAAGFLLTRFVLPHKVPPGSRETVTDNPAESGRAGDRTQQPST